MLLTIYAPKNASGTFFLKHLTSGAPNVKFGTKCLENTSRNGLISMNEHKPKATTFNAMNDETAKKVTNVMFYFVTDPSITSRCR